MEKQIEGKSLFQRGVKADVERMRSFPYAILIAMAGIMLTAGCGPKSANTQPATASQPDQTTQPASASQPATAETNVSTNQSALASRAAESRSAIPEKAAIEIETIAKPPSNTQPADIEKPAEKIETKPVVQPVPAKPVEEKATGPERILSLDVRISVGSDGMLDITETYKIYSEGKFFNRGMIRELPRPPEEDTHKTPPPINLNIREASIDGNTVAFQIKNHGRLRWVFVGDQNEGANLSRGEHVIVLKYQVQGHIVSDSRLEELVWTATGNWPFSADQVSVLVQLPGKPVGKSVPAGGTAAEGDEIEPVPEPSTASAPVAATSPATASGKSPAVVKSKKPGKKKAIPLYEGKIVTGNGKEKAFEPVVMDDGTVLFRLSGPIKKGEWLVVTVRYPPVSSMPAGNEK